jgi:8-oxo-dGTP diphosphatase
VAEVTPEIADALFYFVPRTPASAGAMIFDRRGRLLILKPTYKKGWTIPGGMVETGESPWEACRREVQEEAGLAVTNARLACVDFLHPRPGKPGGLRLLFDCGVLDDEELGRITLQEVEISAHQLADIGTALRLLSGPLRRRVGAAYRSASVLYLEDGRPVLGFPDIGGNDSSGLDDRARERHGGDERAIQP